MIVRRITRNDVEAFRALRLRSLRSDPDAFDSSYDREAGRSLDTWTTWAALSANGPDQAMFLAEANGEPIGLSGAFRLEDEPRTMHLVAMWVDPSHRRYGVARALTKTIIDWARHSDADAVALWVVEGNEAARRLYESEGFTTTGESKALPSNPDLVEHRLTRSLGTRLRMPDGYVDLEPMTTAEIRAFVEWVIAERTSREMVRTAVPLAGASDRVRSRVAALIDGPPGTSHGFFTLIAGSDPDPQGWLWLRERRRDGRRIAVIEELVVFEAFRGRGLAVSAVDAAIVHAEDTGIETIEAVVSHDNGAAVRIAAACRFVEIARSGGDITFRLDVAHRTAEAGD